MQRLDRLRAKLGDLWWYTILLFVVQRFGDAINMFAGLWLVPKYVPMKELGAVLPLTTIVSFIGIPLSIVSIPFLKFIAVFAEKKEFGKAKALIRDTFIGTAVFAVFSILIAYFILPLFFERLRIENGSLALLLVTVTVLGAVSCIFYNAVTGLKLFSASIWFNALTAPLRLFILIALMPFRPLVGYVAGGAANPIVTIIGSFVVLRRFFKTTRRYESYWKDYGSAIWHYTWPLAVSTMVTIAASNMDALVIRHRLSEFESAGYYIITRFSDISMQLGSVFVAFLIPLLAGKNGADHESKKLTLQSVIGMTAAGSLLSIALALFGRPLLELSDIWSPYAPLTPHMVALSVCSSIGMASLCITTTLTARSQFGFLWLFLPIQIIKSLLLYMLTGYSFFSEWMPNEMINALAAFNPCRLSVVIWIWLVTSILTFIGLMLYAFNVKRDKQGVCQTR